MHLALLQIKKTRTTNERIGGHLELEDDEEEYVCHQICQECHRPEHGCEPVPSIPGFAGLVKDRRRPPLQCSCADHHGDSRNMEQWSTFTTGRLRQRSRDRFEQQRRWQKQRRACLIVIGVGASRSCGSWRRWAGRPNEEVRWLRPLGQAWEATMLGLAGRGVKG